MYIKQRLIIYYLFLNIPCYSDIISLKYVYISINNTIKLRNSMYYINKIQRNNFYVYDNFI